MNMEQLRYFLSVARHRNFTEAAKEFYLTQPAITHQISALEQDLGIKLLQRTTRSVSLTGPGSSFWRTPSGCWTWRSGPGSGCARRSTPAPRCWKSAI